VNVKIENIKKQFILFAGSFILKLFDSIVVFFANNKIVKENLIFKDKLETLEMNWEAYFKEYIHYKNTKTIHQYAEFYTTDSDIGQYGNWTGGPVMLWDYIIEDNFQLCPKTAEILKIFPNCKSIVFSTLGEDKYVYPHKGIYKGILRVLLCLDVGMEGKAWAKIGDQKYEFEIGKSIIFDETVMHEVYNGSNRPRVVLYLDLLRPFYPPLSWLNEVIYGLMRKSFFVQKMLQSYKKIDQNTEIIDRRKANFDAVS
jgi:aspartyl/asparaginyl beta-hydroxylase (cupin superfamily)